MFALVIIYYSQSSTNKTENEDGGLLEKIGSGLNKFGDIGGDIMGKLIIIQFLII